jgi:quinoprotein glucose dehydrogenase
MKKFLPHFIVMVGGWALATCTHENATTDYPIYGGNKQNNRYSPLTQINKDNVNDLQLAWTYNSADTGSAARREHEIQCQPIVIKGILYATSSTLKLFALDAATGKELWKFDPFKNKKPRINQCRGVTYWTDGNNDQRLFYAAGSDLYAINAITGAPINSFGDSGKISLYTGLDLNHPVEGLYVTATSPGIIYKNTIIIGAAVSESGDAAPGYIRGFDVLTGKLSWNFHTIPQPGEPGYDTWPKDAYKWAGGVNNWSGLSLDEKRGAVYLGTGSPSSDFYGGDRPGDNLYADCIVSLDAATGKLNWYFQTIHHDLWDRDIPCPPNLATINHNGKPVDVVVQSTKDGLIYVLDRDNGASLFPLEDRPVPQSGLPGEHPAATQRYPQKPLPFAHQTITEDDLTNLSPEAHAFVKRIFDQTTNAHTNAVAPTANPAANKFLPPDTLGTLLVGYSGGAEWGGNAIDPDGILYQNGNDAPWLLKMISQKDREKQIAEFNATAAKAARSTAETKAGPALYIANCSACHGADRKGNHHEIPDLTTVKQRLQPADIAAILAHGQNRMPSFTQLPDQQRAAIIRYLLNDNKPPNNRPPKTKPNNTTPSNTTPSNTTKPSNTTRPSAGQAGVGMPLEAHRMGQNNDPKNPTSQSAAQTELRRSCFDTLLLVRGLRSRSSPSRPGPRSNPTSPNNEPFPYHPPYTAEHWDKLTDSAGYPGIKPPWGTLNAIDLNTGDYLWRVPLGEFEELTKKGIAKTGMESYGGPLVTKSGLIFIAGTRDNKLRAFDAKTGKELWEQKLPNAAFSTPITYTVDNTQYIVIAAGGGRGLPTGGNYLAFSLKK